MPDKKSSRLSSRAATPLARDAKKKKSRLSFDTDSSEDYSENISDTVSQASADPNTKQQLKMFKEMNNKIKSYQAKSCKSTNKRVINK